MKVSRTVLKPNIGFPSGQAGELDQPIRYGFSTKLEAMFASRAVRTLMDSAFPDNESGKFVPRFKTSQTMDVDAVRDAQEAIGLRLDAFNNPSIAHRLDPFLTSKQSTDLWNTIGWVVDPSKRETMVNAHAGFLSVVAGALVLRKAILDIEHPAYVAGVALLEARERTGLSRLRPGPRLPEQINSYNFDHLPDDTTQVTVIAENTHTLDI